jgi:hypothetical protein
VDTNRVPQPRHDDDTVEAHYACLERLCACLEGWVFVGYIDEHGEERSLLPLSAVQRWQAELESR